MFPEKMTQGMVERHDLLEKNGVLVPKNYSVSNAILYQLFLENDFHDVFETSKGEQRISYIKQLADIARTLDELKFFPLNFVRDLREQDGKVFYVDFGCDLGAPTEVKREKAKETLLNSLDDQREKDIAKLHYAKVLN